MCVEFGIVTEVISEEFGKWGSRKMDEQGDYRGCSQRHCLQILEFRGLEGI